MSVKGLPSTVAMGIMSAWSKSLTSTLKLNTVHNYVTIVQQALEQMESTVDAKALKQFHDSLGYTQAGTLRAAWKRFKAALESQNIGVAEVPKRVALKGLAKYGVPEGVAWALQQLSEAGIPPSYAVRVPVDRTWLTQKGCLCLQPANVSYKDKKVLLVKHPELQNALRVLALWRGSSPWLVPDKPSSNKAMKSGKFISICRLARNKGAQMNTAFTQCVTADLALEG